MTALQYVGFIAVGNDSQPVYKLTIVTESHLADAEAMGSLAVVCAVLAELTKASYRLSGLEKIECKLVSRG